MNRIGVPESEHKELVAYLKKTYRYEDGGIVNRRTGRRVQGSKKSNGYLGFTIRFNGNRYSSLTQRIVWALCNNELPTQTIDHMNGNRLDNRIENLREVCLSDNRLNMLLPWKPNQKTNVTGIEMIGRKYRTWIHGRRLNFLNPYEAFYWAIACGKRYRSGLCPSE